MLMSAPGEDLVLIVFCSLGVHSHFLILSIVPYSFLFLFEALEAVFA